MAYIRGIMYPNLPDLSNWMSVVEFPLGGYVWYQTGLDDPPQAEKRAQQAMDEVRTQLGLSDLDLSD